MIARQLAFDLVFDGEIAGGNGRCRLEATLSREEAARLAQCPRDQAMIELRVKHRWSLQAIGNLYGLSRERVRQITPPIEGTGVTPTFDTESRPVPEQIEADLSRVLRQAVRSPDAWNARGGISKAWVVARLGYDPGEHWNFRDARKVEMFLRCGLGLESREEMIEWANRMYYDEGMTYEDVTRWLSDEFVPVTVMSVYRFLTGELGFEGRRTGRR
jgi:hypothetical protein